jgi:riboflavin kinase/FMN adenylyltransferase
LSSTQIREMIAEGDVAGAAVALARPHELWGEVVQGSGRGRTIGVPTANLALSPGVAVPKRGVYAVTAGRSAGESIPGVANVGVRPTFDGRDETVEAHLLGFKGDLYGETLRVRFVDRIRDERKFENVDQLVEQIRRDIEAARQILVGGTGNG